MGRIFITQLETLCCAYLGLYLGLTRILTLSDVEKKIVNDPCRIALPICFKMSHVIIIMQYFYHVMTFL